MGARQFAAAQLQNSATHFETPLGFLGMILLAVGAVTNTNILDKVHGPEDVFYYAIVLNNVQLVLISKTTQPRAKLILLINLDFIFQNKVLFQGSLTNGYILKGIKDPFGK